MKVMQKMIRVFIADDHRLVREGIRRLLEDCKDEFEICGEAGTGRELLDEIKKAKADVLLLDVSMPDLDGFEVTKQLAKQSKPPKIVILTMYADEHFAARLIRAGAVAYIVKDAAPSELAEAIRAVHDGRRFISESLREALAMRYVEGGEQDPVSLLTDREFQVVQRLSSGGTNREIAEELGLSVKTVDAHRLKILAKLHLRNNAELTKFALRHGLIKS